MMWQNKKDHMIRNLITSVNWSVQLNLKMDPQKELGHGTDCLLNCQLSTCLAKLADEPLPFQICSPFTVGQTQLGHGCALAEPGGPWHPTFALGRLENLICWAPKILQFQSTGLLSIFLRAQPWIGATQHSLAIQRSCLQQRSLTLIVCRTVNGEAITKSFFSWIFNFVQLWLN